MSRATLHRKFKIKTIDSMWGKVKIIEGYRGVARTYIRRQGKGKHTSYYLSTSFYPSMDNMLDVNGEYHFGTLKELKEALNTW